MDGRQAVKVGMLGTAAIALIVGLLWYLSHFDPDTYDIKVKFSNTSGLVAQSPARMRGVIIGEVKRVELVGLQPVVTLKIQNKIRIPRDSVFAISTGLLIMSPRVEITPGQQPFYLANGDTVTGATPAGPLAQLSPELAGSVQNLNTTMADLTKRFDVAAIKINHILDQSSKLVDNLDQTVSTAKHLVGDERLHTSLIATTQNFQAMSENARDTSVTLRKKLTEIASSSQGQLHGLTDKLGNILTRIDSTIDAANTVVKKLTDQVTDPRLQQSLQETVELARTTLARFDQIAADIHQLTGDPEMQRNLKTTVGNLQSASEKGAEALNKVNSILGAVTGTASKARGFKFPSTTIEANVSSSFDPSRLRIDLDARLGFGRNILMAGLYDFGQDARLDLQGGFRPNDTVTLRYGLYASKIGVGMDWEPRSGYGIRGDLFDTVHPQLDIRGFLRVNNDASFWVGAEDIFEKPVPIVGIRYRH